MKRMLITVAVALAILAGGYSIVSAADPPHTDYRLLGTPGYSPSGCSGSACHYTKNRFVQDDLSSNVGNNYNNLCLGCHNAAGEAHDKQAGTPSNNVYNNHTGLLPGNAGNSHSWNGSIGDAGTRAPVASGFSGTAHMPGGKVRCQTCHEGMVKTEEENINWASTTDSGDHTNFTISWGSSSTKQYLAQYIKVYRYPTAVTRPSESRTKKNYLVSETEYTYDSATRIITFNQAQSTPVYIYADIAQPYYRVGNAANAICVDCHNNRLDRAVSHAPGTGAKDSHPVMVPFANRSGLSATLKGSADSNIFIEGGNVECTSCHDPHNAASKEGMILRNADKSLLCTNCHKVNGYGGYSTVSLAMHNGAKHTGPTVCADCHTTHNTNNVMLIRNNVNGVAVNFQNFSGTDNFVNGSGTGLCQVCHSATAHYKADGSGQDHQTGRNCLACHAHFNGFLPAGGGTCDGCHGQPPAPGNAGPTGWSDTTGNLHTSHMAHLNTATFGYLTGSAACAACHGTKPGNSHPESLSTAYIDLSNWGGSFSDGGTAGSVNTDDDTCTNVNCHNASGTRSWGASGGCESCHNYPASANNWSAGNTHLAHVSQTGYDAASDKYATVTADSDKCGRCHSGGTHQNEVKDVASTVAPGLAYNTTSQTCTNACHKNQDVSSWGGSGNCNMCHYRNGSTIGKYSQMSGLHVSPSRTWGHYSSNIKVNGASITCANCHPDNDADTASPRQHIKDTDFVKRADMSGAFQNVTVTGVGYAKGATIASGTCTKSCHYNPTDPFGDYTICFKPGQKKRFGAYEAAKWNDNNLKCNECHSTPSQEATYGHMSSAASKNANKRHENHMFKYKLNPFNYKDGDRNIYCDDCHRTPDINATRGFHNHSTLGENGSGVISLPVKSQNAKVNLSFRNNGLGRDNASPASFTAPGGVPTCSNVYCHTIMTTGDWTGRECNACHGKLDGVDPGSGAPGFTNLTAAGASLYEDYLGGGGAHYSHVMKRGYPCRTCHVTGGGDGNPANHHNLSETVSKANVDVAIEEQWWFHNVTAVYDPDTRSCANVSCHYGSSQNWDCGAGH